MNRRGRILRDTNAGPGIVTSDGKQFSFTLEGMWMSDIPPRPGMSVDLTFNDEGVPVALRAVPENQVAKEQAQQALAGARTQGTALASKLQARFGAPLLIAVAVLVVGWFFVDSLSLQGARMQFTFWQLLGFAGDGQALYSLLDKNTTTSSGMYGVLALIALAAPFAHFFWKDRRAALGGCLPLLVMILVAFEVRSSFRSAFERGAQEFGRLASDPHAWDRFITQLGVSLDMGAYLSLAAAMYLAWAGARQFLTSRQALPGPELQCTQTVA